MNINQIIKSLKDILDDLRCGVNPNSIETKVEVLIENIKRIKRQTPKIRESDHRCKGGFGSSMGIALIRATGGGIFRGDIGWMFGTTSHVTTVEYCPFCGVNLEQEWQKDHP